MSSPVRPSNMAPATDYRTQLQESLGSTYRIERELGGGGMSHVFVAEETALGRKVVLKVLPADLVSGSGVERFNREIHLAANLQQAQIVPVLTAGEVNGAPYYTMPFVEGESLRAKLARDGVLPIAEVVSILRDVTRALAYAHQHDVVHRDIKPDNVLLSGGTAVVTDFGIAKAISAARATDADSAITQSGVSVGTPAYISPEQAAGDPDVDHRADIYSLGCMAYELLAGHVPFHNRTPQKILVAHLTEPPTPIGTHRPDIPPQLAALIMHCLEKDRDKRPADASRILAALEVLPTESALSLSGMVLGGPGAMKRALIVYGTASLAVAIVARAAVVGFGLPDWVFVGAVILIVLGLPLLLAAGRRLTWRRATSTGGGVLGAFAALTAAVMILSSLGIGPAASLMAAGTMRGRERLVVVDFETRQDTSLSHVVTEAVRTGLGQSRVVSIMPPTAIAAALQRMQRPPLTHVDVSLAREIAQREGAKAIVAGSVTPLGAGYIVAIRLVSADSGSDLAAFQKTVDGPSQLLDAIDGLTRKLRARIGESLKTVRDAPALDKVTTSSLDALRKYAEGVRAADIEGDYTKAAALMREAVSRDTSFAMAYRKLGVALGNNGMPKAQVDSALTRAFQYRDRLPEKERYLAIGSYYSSGPGRNRLKASEALEQALNLDTTDVTVLNNLGLILRTRREFARAESLYLRLAELRPTQISMTNLAGVLFADGKVAQSESVYKELLRQFPTSQSGQVAPALFMYYRGQLDSVEAFWKARRAVPNLIAKAGAISNLATYAQLRGKIKESLSLYNEARTAHAARGVPANPLSDTIVAAGAAIWFLGQNERGVQMLDTAAARTPFKMLPVEQRPYFVFAIYYALAGRVDKSRAMLAQFDADVSDTSYRATLEPGRHGVLAEIAMADKRPLDAVREKWKSDSMPDGPASECAFCIEPDLGRAYDLADMPDSAIAHWERYIASPDVGRMTNDASYLPGIHKRLGELYDAKGNAQRAASHYLAFIELWKNADLELQPKVAEVRKRLAQLKGVGGK